MPRINYPIAQEKLTGRCKRSRKIGNHTYLERDEIDPAVIHLRLWRSRIATLYPDGSVRLDSCGYRSITTLDRMRWVLQGIRGVNVWGGFAEWWIYYRYTNSLFADGCVVHSDGSVTGYAPGDFEEYKKQYHRAIYQRNKLTRIATIGGLTEGDVVNYQSAPWIVTRLYTNLNCRQVASLRSLDGNAKCNRISIRQWGYGAMKLDPFLTAVRRRGELREAIA